MCAGRQRLPAFGETRNCERKLGESRQGVCDRLAQLAALANVLQAGYVYRINDLESPRLPTGRPDAARVNQGKEGKCRKGYLIARLPFSLLCSRHMIRRSPRLARRGAKSILARRRATCLANLLPSGYSVGSLIFLAICR